MLGRENNGLGLLGSSLAVVDHAFTSGMRNSRGGYDGMRNDFFF